MIDTTIDIIFKGEFLKIDLAFLKPLIVDAIEFRFNTPEEVSKPNHEDLISILKTKEYVDFVISTNNLKIENKIVPNVFINGTLDAGQFELLMFFDIKDLGNVNHTIGLEFLKEWSISFQNNYNFNSFVCQIDNGNEAEYYFDNNGWGPLFNKI